MTPHDSRFEILGTNAIALNSPLAPALAENIEESYLDSPERLVVRWSLDNAQKLADAGFDPPSPFRQFYQWPVKPFSHQIRTSEFITVHRRCGVWSEMGTGKTASALAAIDYLIQRNKIRRALVVSPVSVMRAAWQKDCIEMFPRLRLGVAHGTQEYRRSIINDTDLNIVVINYDALRTMLPDLMAADFDCFVADEANAVKTPGAKRTKAFSKLTAKDGARVVLMTGTPASQSPEDAYVFGRLLHNPNTPRTMSAWRDRTMYRQSMFVWTPKETAPGDVARILTPSIRYNKQDCLDLPDRVYVDRETPMTSVQVLRYKELKNEGISMLADGTVITAANAAILLGKLLQVSAGAVYDEEHNKVFLDFTPRYQELVDIIAQTERKVIVFANFTSVIDELVRKLNADKIPTTKLDGSVSMNNRAQVIEAFQIGPKEVNRVIIIQPQAAAHGITLTAADTVVWWGPPYSVELYKQANDRPHRIGQTQKVTVIHLTSSPIERKVLNNLRRNIGVHEAAIELFNDLAYSGENE